jgi:hypothetical protein
VSDLNTVQEKRIWILAFWKILQVYVESGSRQEPPGHFDFVVQVNWNVAEPEPQGAASFWWRWSRNAMQLWLRRFWPPTNLFTLNTFLKIAKTDHFNQF